MRDPKRIDKVLNTLKMVWKMYPDTRFCQLMVSVLGTERLNDVYYMEDEDLLKQIQVFFKNVH